MSFAEIPSHLVVAIGLALEPAGAATQSLDVLLTRHPELATAYATAAGAFRFSEQSWLRGLKESGCGAVCDTHAPSIFRTTSGRYYVPAAAERKRILDLRNAHDEADHVARAVARMNAVALTAHLGRAPTAGELLAAHLAGPERAATLIAQAAPVTAPVASKGIGTADTARKPAVALRGRAAEPAPTKPAALASNWRTEVRPAR